MVERLDAAEVARPLELPHSLPRAQRRRFVRSLLMASDVITLSAASLGAALLRFRWITPAGGLEHTLDQVTYLQLSLILAAVWVVAIWFEHLYDVDRVFRGSGEFSRLVRALAMGVVAFLVVSYMLKVADLSRLWVMMATGLALLFCASGRLGARALLAWLRRHDRFLRPTLIVGSNGEAEDLRRVLSADSSTGIRPVGCLATSKEDRLALDFCHGIPCLGTAREVADIVSGYGIDTVVIASSAFDRDVLARIVADLRDVDVDIDVSSGLFEVLTSRMIVREISGLPLLTVKGITLSKRNLLTKRAFDLVVASGIIVLGLPLWLLFALVIKVTSRGPVLYAQKRVGKDGESFGMLKFRSMVSGADAQHAALATGSGADDRLFKMKDDPRVTSVGRWMRKFSLDEFPQLINVVRGEMSLVGPRPPLPHEVDRYSTSDWRRLEVLPGMTGLWQVSGRSNLTFDEMVRLDLFYIENWSVRLDMSLMFRTIPAVLFAKGAY